MYKSGAKQSIPLNTLYAWLSAIWREANSKAVSELINNPKIKPENDDQLDALVGWVLGTLLLEGNPTVDILGNLITGAIALPVTSDLKDAFTRFVTNSKHQ